MASFIADLTSEVVSPLLNPAVRTADVATNPAVSVDTSLIAGPRNIVIHLGTIHADTTGTITVVESDTGTNGTWTAVASGGVQPTTAITFTGTSDDTVIRRVVNNNKRYVGLLVDADGATISYGISAVLIGTRQYN